MTTTCVVVDQHIVERLGASVEKTGPAGTKRAQARHIERDRLIAEHGIGEEFACCMTREIGEGRWRMAVRATCVEECIEPASFTLEGARRRHIGQGEGAYERIERHLAIAVGPAVAAVFVHGDLVEIANVRIASVAQKRRGAFESAHVE